MIDDGKLTVFRANNGRVCHADDRAIASASGEASGTMPARTTSMNKPNWWASQDASTLERVKETLHRDWDQTKHDLHMGGHELNQKLADTVGQAAGTKPMPPIDKANPPKVIGRWEDAEIPMGYGYAARTHFGGQYPRWNDELEGKLKADWQAETPWPAIQHFVRRGYDIKR